MLTPSVCETVKNTITSSLPVHWCLRYRVRWLLCASLRSFRPPTSPFRQPSQTEHFAVSSQHISLPDFLSRRSDSFELCPIRCVIWPSSLNWTHLFAGNKRHERIVVSPFHTVAIYKSTFTYLPGAAWVTFQLIPIPSGTMVEHSLLLIWMPSVFTLFEDNHRRRHHVSCQWQFVFVS